MLAPRFPTKCTSGQTTVKYSVVNKHAVCVRAFGNLHSTLQYFFYFFVSFELNESLELND